MATPNLEVIPPDSSNTNPGADSKQFGSWPADPAQAAQRSARTAMIVAVLALLVAAGGTFYQSMSSQKMAEALLSKTKAELTKALDAEKKKNDISAKLTDAMTTEEKAVQEKLDKATADLTKAYQQDLMALRTELEEMKKSAARVPASTGKAPKKKKKH